MRTLKAIFRLVALTTLAPLCAATAAESQDVGEGAVVVGNANVPVYAHSEGKTVEALAEPGDYVAGITVTGLFSHGYSFETKNNRVHVLYFANKEQVGIQRTAWMDPAHLEKFTYDCSCGAREFPNVKSEQCSPLAASGFVKRKWNACFQQARDQKVAALANPQGPAEDRASVPEGTPVEPTGGEEAGDEKPLSADDILKATSAGEGDHASREPAGTPPGSPGQTPSGGTTPHASKPFTNSDVVALVKAGLGDKVVISKIRSVPGDDLDTSTEALISLKAAGVSKTVIDAILKRATKP
jgi:hypothetical protein